MTAYYSDVEAANGMREAFKDLKRIGKDKDTYEWGWTPPQSLLRDEHNAAERVRAAVRYFMDAPEDEDDS